MKLMVVDTALGLCTVGVFEVHDGRITYWRDYFDLATIMARGPGFAADAPIFAEIEGLAERYPDAPAAKGAPTSSLKTFVTSLAGHVAGEAARLAACARLVPGTEFASNDDMTYTAEHAT